MECSRELLNRNEVQSIAKLFFEELILKKRQRRESVQHHYNKMSGRATQKVYRESSAQENRTRSMIEYIVQTLFENTTNVFDTKIQLLKATY